VLPQRNVKRRKIKINNKGRKNEEQLKKRIVEKNNKCSRTKKGKL